MSTNQPPAGPPAEQPQGTPPPPPADGGFQAPPPPPAEGGYQAPPPAAGYAAPAPGGYAPPAGQYAAPAGQYGQPGAQQQLGVPRPGELVDRLLARLIDGVILGVGFGILYAVFSSIFLRGFVYSTGEWFLFWLFTAVLSSVLYLGYFGFLESTRGASIGKQVLKLRVVGPDGVSNPTMEQAVRRNIWMASNLLNVVPILGSLLSGAAMLVAVIMIAVGINGDPVNRQAWHDRFAGGTRVLKVG